MEQKKRIYVAPAMQVVELKARHTLLVGSGNIDGFTSGGKVNDWSNDEEVEE